MGGARRDALVSPINPTWIRSSGEQSPPTSSRAAHQIRADHQHEDRQGTRPDNPARGAAASRRRRALLAAALGFLQLPPKTSALRALHAWLDNWRGVGLIVVGMERYGFRLSLKKYGNGEGAWVASFNRDVMTSADGFGSGATPWRAVQQAAWVAMRRAA